MEAGGRTIVVPAALLLALLAAGASAAPPRVMLLVAERNLGALPTNAVEALAIERLNEHGMAVVEPEGGKAGVENRQALRASAGDDRGAAALGLKSGADIVIVGDAVSRASTQQIAESSLRSYEAMVTLRAVRTDNSENLASASETGTAIDIEDINGGSKALKAAGEKAVASLIPSMLANWTTVSSSLPVWRKITVTVRGVDAAWKLKAIRESLRRKTRDLTQRSYKRNVAVFDAESMTEARELAESIVAEPPNGLDFRVRDVDEGGISLLAVRRARR